MNSRNRIISVISVFALITLFSGCASNRRAYSGNRVSTREYSSGHIRINRTYAFRSSDGLHVGGSIRRDRIRGGGISRGHVDVIALGENGEVISESSATIIPSHLSRRTGASSVFHTILPSDSADRVSNIELAYHRGFHGIVQ